MLSLDKPLSDEELDIGSFFVVKLINSETSNAFCWLNETVFGSKYPLISDSTAGIAVTGVSVVAAASNCGWISLKWIFWLSSSSFRKSPLIERNESIKSSGLADHPSDCKVKTILLIHFYDL